MPILTGGNVIEGGLRYTGAGAPAAGTNAVQTLTIGGTPTGGTFKLALEGFTTAAITWSATNATLIANIDAALEAIASVGTGGVTTAVGTMTAGIGTATLTFAGNRGLQPVTLATVADNSLTGTSPTLAIATTTPGVRPGAAGASIGAEYTDTTNGKLYINTGTAAAPTWTVVGSQS
jgi:hypothetical protein